MTPLAPRRKRLMMIRTMARATGVDLARARRDAALTRADWSEMVERCRACQWQGCTRFLKDAGSDWGQRTPPFPCRNGEVFRRLAEAQTSRPQRS